MTNPRKSRKRPSNQPEDAQGAGGPRVGRRRELMNNAIRRMKRLLNVGMLLISVLFLRSLWARLPHPALDSIAPFVILKASLLVYVYCWYHGCMKDLDVQHDVIRDPPTSKWQDIAVGAFIVCAFGLLFYLENERLLVVALCTFLALNVVAWSYLRATTDALVLASAEEYDVGGDVVGKVKTLLFREYMFGAWQWYRFGTGGALVALLALVAYELLPLPSGMTTSLAVALIVALLVATMESWMWLRRFTMQVRRDGLDWLEKNDFIVAPHAGRSSAQAGWGSYRENLREVALRPELSLPARSAEAWCERPSGAQDGMRVLDLRACRARADQSPTPSRAPRTLAPRDTAAVGKA
jgi:hypothetical protein